MDLPSCFGSGLPSWAHDCDYIDTPRTKRNGINDFSSYKDIRCHAASHLASALMF